jgi:hypothetical protein
MVTTVLNELSSDSGTPVKFEGPKL